jgi:hypothetical protein
MFQTGKIKPKNNNEKKTIVITNGKISYGISDAHNAQISKGISN